MELYQSAMQEQTRREQQRRRMIRWRKQKKEKKLDMVEERRRLEKELQRRVLEARMAFDELTIRSAAEAYRHVTVERAVLMSENVALKEAIEDKLKVKAQLERETQEFLDQIRSNEPPVLARRDDDGWCVQLPNGAPSFYFSPFTWEEFDNILKNNDVVYAERHPCTATVGKILGWTVDYAPLVRNEAGTSFVAHARFTRRLRCSLDKAHRILPHLDKNVWPVLVTPRSWGCAQTGSICYQPLQNFNENALIMVGNIPGEVHLRYIVLARHTREQRPDGKRVDKYIMAIADSEVNFRNRQAEGEQENVKWVLEGGLYMTITEVNENTIDVVFDQWSECLNEMHGRELYIDWIRFPVRIEQYVSPARLLSCTIYTGGNVGKLDTGRQFRDYSEVSLLTIVA
ncbi:hypothetical protein F444_09172 [Phytophthora nicotianae P1976]|uniref:Uncharacterized protein n=1 Tax=Phytophthora nicotianae P1976 TaxID=1317066 RepID=A0A081A8J9_PHYNI|nr:hypothetical protein F444_09172 [Phytophthora nicotianae P1976]